MEPPWCGGVEGGDVVGGVGEVNGLVDVEREYPGAGVRGGGIGGVLSMVVECRPAGAGGTVVAGGVAGCWRLKNC